MYINFPDFPQVGDKYNTDNGCYEWDGSKWKLDRVYSRETKTTETPPDDPQLGQLWWDANLANLFIYYYNAWVPVGSTPAQYPSLPESGLHILCYNDGETYWERII